MGYYIETNAPKGKVEILKRDLGATELSADEAEMILREDIGGAVICVVDNGPFEAAAYCYDLDEFRTFSDPGDHRPKTWLLVANDTLVKELTRFNK